MQGGFDMKLKYISGIVLTSVLLVACGNSDESKEDKDEATGGNKGTSDKVITINKVKTNPTDAIKKAQQTYTNQDLKGISFEKSNGKWSYKVEQQGQNKESEVVIADSNGKVLHKESEKENDIDKREAFHYDDVIDYKKAIKKGQKEFDGEIREWSLAKDDGQLVYDMDLSKDQETHEITVDAKNGKVLQNETDN